MYPLIIYVSDADGLVVMITDITSADLRVGQKLKIFRNHFAQYWLSCRRHVLLHCRRGAVCQVMMHGLAAVFSVGTCRESRSASVATRRRAGLRRGAASKRRDVAVSFLGQVAQLSDASPRRYKMALSSAPTTVDVTLFHCQSAVWTRSRGH